MDTGIPFSVGDLSGLSTIVAGSVYWIIGIDLLLVGLGLWVRHKFAQLAAILMFAIAAAFQFFQFLLLGVFGSSASVVMLLVNAVFAYFLYSKFDAQTTAVAKSRG